MLVGIVVEVVWVLLGFVRLGNVGIVLVYVVVQSGLGIVVGLGVLRVVSEQVVVHDGIIVSDEMGNDGVIGDGIVGQLVVGNVSVVRDSKLVGYVLVVGYVL